MLRNIFEKIFAYLATFSFWLLIKTCRLSFSDVELLKTHGKKGNCLLLLWHNRLCILPEILKIAAADLTYTAFISKSRDGNPLALIVESYPQATALRVGHSTRHQALKHLIERLEESKDVVIVTPDGPKGPKYELKPGAILAAQTTGAAIITTTWKASSYWSLSTWDGMMIPKPFSSIVIKFSGPYTIAKDQAIDVGCQEIKSYMKDEANHDR